MSSPASLDPDTYATVISKLSTSDVLACAQVCTRLRELCLASLQSSHAVEERGTGITGGALRWLALRRLRGVTRIELVDCGELTKASITSAVAGCDSLASLSALRVGPGSWALGHIERLLAVAPPSLASVRLDVLLEMKKDLHEGSHLLAALARPSLRVEKLTLVSDNVSRAAAPSDASGTEAATAALAALDVGSDGDDDAAEEGAEGAPCALGRLCAALLAGGGVEELDASSGALDLPGAASRLLAPLLTARGCLLRRLSARHLDRRSVRTLARALRSNGSLDSLNLSSNMVYGRAASDFAAALAGHASLTALDLDHNPLLDGGGAAVAAVLPSTPIRSLSLCFTGVGDAACDALALALAGDCRLRSLRLSGNRITSSGATSLAASLGKLAHLDLTANVRLDGAATAALAIALPASALRSLRLSGCNVDRKACSRLAAALPLSRLARLDLSSNHFSDGGSDELAWVLGGCGSLTALSLADCNIGDEGADELLEALADADAPPSVRSIDLRWNKLGSTHQGGRGVSGDPRADASSQKQRTAAERQTEHLEHTWQQAKAAGKPQKVYVPKWQREVPGWCGKAKNSGVPPRLQVARTQELPGLVPCSGLMVVEAGSESSSAYDSADSHISEYSEVHESDVETAGAAAPMAQQLEEALTISSCDPTGSTKLDANINETLYFMQEFQTGGSKAEEAAEAPATAEEEAEGPATPAAAEEEAEAPATPAAAEAEAPARAAAAPAEGLSNAEFRRFLLARPKGPAQPGEPPAHGESAAASVSGSEPPPAPLPPLESPLRGYALDSSHLRAGGGVSRRAALNPLADCWSRTDALPKLCLQFATTGRCGVRGGQCRYSHAVQGQPEALLHAEIRRSANRRGEADGCGCGDFVPLSLGRAVLSARPPPASEEEEEAAVEEALSLARRAREETGAHNLEAAQASAALLALLAERYQRPGSAPPSRRLRKGLLRTAALLHRGGLKCDTCGRAFDACCFWSLTARVEVAAGGRRLLCCASCARREGFWDVGDGASKLSREACHFFAAGACREGSRCRFVHVGAPPKAPLGASTYEPRPGPSRVSVARVPRMRWSLSPHGVAAVLPAQPWGLVVSREGSALIRLPEGLLLAVDGVWFRDGARLVEWLCQGGEEEVRVEYYAPEGASQLAAASLFSSQASPPAASASSAASSPPAGGGWNAEDLARRKQEVCGELLRSATCCPTHSPLRRYVEQMVRRARAVCDGGWAPLVLRPLAALTAECEAEAASLQPPEGDAALRRAIVERLEAHAQTVAPGSRLRVFGSSSCGLNAAGADLDLTLETPRAMGHTDKVQLVDGLAMILGSRSGWEGVEGVARARVPIVKCVDSDSRIPADISIDNRRARAKTALLASYARCDPRVRTLLFVVKRWAARRAINDPRASFPNSYTWCQLLIAYLQLCSPPVLPSLTSLAGGEWSDAWSADPLLVLPGLDEGGDGGGEGEPERAAHELRRDHAAVLEAAAAVAAASRTSQDVGSLLSGFFHFWADWLGEGGSGRGGALAQWWVVCTRIGAPLQQADKAWPEGAAGREWHLFPIEDPVDEDHDLGRVLTPRSLAVLKQELSRAAQTLAEGGTLEQVLREHQ